MNYFVSKQSTLKNNYVTKLVLKVYPYPGYMATILQKSLKFRVRVGGSHRPYRSSGYCSTGLRTHTSSGQV